MKGKVKIKITAVADDFKEFPVAYRANGKIEAKSPYFPRTARKVGDTEVMNNTMFGYLKTLKELKVFDFEIIK